MVTMLRYALALWLPLVAATLALPSLAHAEAQGVVAIVNDKPVTEFDISQRITLLKILGDASPDGLSRKKALQSLVDDQVKIVEAKKFNLTPTEADVTGQIARMSKGMQSTPEGLVVKLKKAGIDETSFRTYVSTLIGFNRIIASKYREDIKIAPGDVDAKMADIKNKVGTRMNEIMRDPRMKGLTVYTLLEINLPVEGDDALLLQARAVDAAQLRQRLKGCGNVKAASSGIFNVKAGRKVEVDGARMPPPLKAALDKAGQGGAIGPMRTKGGIQLVVFCGTRKISPQKPKFEMPNRQQVENMLVNEKYDSFEEQYLKTARQGVYVEYRNQSYSQ